MWLRLEARIDLFQCPAFFEFSELLHSPGVSAVGEFGNQKNLDNIANLIFTQKIGAQAEHIAMIVLTGSPSRDFIVSQCGTDAVNFICRHTHPYPRPIE